MLILHGIYDNGKIEITDKDIPGIKKSKVIISIIEDTPPQNVPFKESLLKGSILSKKELADVLKARKWMGKWKIPAF